jgi:hypothetical protein
MFALGFYRFVGGQERIDIRDNFFLDYHNCLESNYIYGNNSSVVNLQLFFLYYYFKIK